MKERFISVVRYVPNGCAACELVSAVEFAFREASLRLRLLGRGEFPNIVDVNRVLMSGRGDDGFIIHTWEPYSLSADEFASLRRRAQRRGKRRKEIGRKKRGSQRP